MDLSVISANPLSWGCKKVSGIDPTYSNPVQELPPAGGTNFWSVSGQKSAIFRLKCLRLGNSPVDPRLGIFRKHFYLPQITISYQILCNLRAKSTFFLEKRGKRDKSVF